MRPKEWERNVAPQIVDGLPGDWVLDGNDMKRLDAENHLAWHVTRAVTRGGGYSFTAVIQPQYIVSKVLDSGLGLRLGHGTREVRSYFTEEHPEQVPVAEIRALVTRNALPFLDRHGRDLRSYVKLPEDFARTRHTRRGTWSTEAAAAGAHTLMGRWKPATKAWQNCLLELAAFDDDLHPEVRKLAAQAVDAYDDQTRAAVVAWLEENESEMRRIWGFP